MPSPKCAIFTEPHVFYSSCLGTGCSHQAYRITSFKKEMNGLWWMPIMPPNEPRFSLENSNALHKHWDMIEAKSFRLFEYVLLHYLSVPIA